VEGVLSTLLEAGPAYLLSAVLLYMLIQERRTVRERDRERDRRLDEVADKLYEVAISGVKKDEQVHGTLEAVRRDLEEVRKMTVTKLSERS
jgi:hypothetical protein